MGVLIGKRCVAQTAESPFSCCTACSAQPVVPTHPMGWAAFFICLSTAKRKLVTASKVRFPSYVRKLDDLTEKPPLPDRPGVGSAEPRIPNMSEVGSEAPPILKGPGGSWEVFGARVTCT